MKLIIAKFKSRCAETGATINKGTQMYYDYTSRKCYSLSSNMAKAAAADHERDSVMSYIDAQERAMFERFERR